MFSEKNHTLLNINWIVSLFEMWSISISLHSVDHGKFLKRFNDTYRLMKMIDENVHYSQKEDSLLEYFIWCIGPLTFKIVFIREVLLVAWLTDRWRLLKISQMFETVMFFKRVVLICKVYVVKKHSKWLDTLSQNIITLDFV